MTYLLILILQTANRYAIDRIEAPSYAACDARAVRARPARGGGSVRGAQMIARVVQREREPGLFG